jgi:hypothetical protein
MIAKNSCVPTMFRSAWSVIAPRMYTAVAKRFRRPGSPIRSPVAEDLEPRCRPDEDVVPRLVKGVVVSRTPRKGSWLARQKDVAMVVGPTAVSVEPALCPFPEVRHSDIEGSPRPDGVSRPHDQLARQAAPEYCRHAAHGHLGRVEQEVEVEPSQSLGAMRLDVRYPMQHACGEPIVQMDAVVVDLVSAIPAKREVRVTDSRTSDTVARRYVV